MGSRSSKLKMVLVADMVLLALVIPGFFYFNTQIGRPAEFIVSGLVLESDWVQVGEPMQIWVNVKNIGDENGNYTVALSVDDIPVLTTDSNITTNEDNNNSIIYTISDVEDDNLTLNIITNAINGTVTIIENKIYYTPYENYNGEDSFEVSVVDSDGVEIIKTINVVVLSVDDAPTLGTILDINKDEDADEFTITLDGNDVDGDTITYSVDSNNSSLVTVSIVDGEIVVTPVADGNGEVTIEVNATANGQTVTQNFKITLTAVDDAPVLTSSILNQSKDEDFDEFNVTLTSSDTENDALTYYASSSDTSKVTVSVVGDKIVVNSKADAYGTVRVDYNVTQDSNASLYDTGYFYITINAINDAPTFVTDLSDLTINEDNGTLNFELNVSDVDAYGLNMYIESNNTDILKVASL